MKGLMFSTELVPKVLDGTKTVTRRIMNPQPFYDKMLKMWLWHQTPMRTIERCNWPMFARYKAGETVYMQESWRPVMYIPGLGAGDVRYKAGSTWQRSCTQEQYVKAITSRFFAWEWYPAMFMPEWASRQLLKIVSVRAKRIQDLSEAEAQREGFGWKCGHPGCLNGIHWAQGSFIKAWGLDFHGVGAWQSNGWVFRYEFERIK